MARLKRRNNREIIETIIKNLSESMTIDDLCKETHIKPKTVINWLHTIHFIHTQCPDFTLVEENGVVTHIERIESTDFKTIQLKSKKRRKDPALNEFFKEFDSVLSKTKKNLDFVEAQLITKEEYGSIQRRYDPRLDELHSELSQVLAKGINHLKSPEIISEEDTPSSDHRSELLQDLKEAVKIGINGLEHIENVEHKIKKKKLTGWRAELAEAFKERERRKMKN